MFRNRGIFAHVVQQAHNVGDTLCSNEPNLRKMPPDRIDQLCSLSDEKVAGAVNNKEGLLLITLDRHVAHRGAAHGFADGRGIGCVVLAPSDIRLHVLRRNQPDIVPEFAKFAPPEVRRRAGFHPNKASRQLGEIDQHFTPPETALLNDAAERVHAVNLEDMLGEIEADRRDLHRGWLLSW